MKVLLFSYFCIEFVIHLKDFCFMDGLEKIIMEGSVFRKSSGPAGDKAGKVKTKAKTTSYIKGAHGSGSAKMKAEYRRRRASR